MTDDERYISFLRKNVPELESIIDINRWHKYKTKASIATKDLVDASYNEMQKIIDVFVKFVDRNVADFTFAAQPVRQKLMDVTPIIVYWHQGIENAPRCVDICIKSLKRNQTKHPVMILDYEQLSTMIDINPDVKRAFTSGNIGYAVYADYLRLKLLEKYDCIWFDATILCIKELPDEYFTTPFFSVHGDYLSGLAYNVRALTYDCQFGQVYVLGGSSNYMYSKVAQLFEYYFSKYDTNFTYFMTYIFFEWLVRNDEKAANELAACPINNTHIEYLTCQRDAEYSDELLKQILSDDTQLYKLSNRIDYNYDNDTMLAKFCRLFIN